MIQFLAINFLQFSYFYRFNLVIKNKFKLTHFPQLQRQHPLTFFSILKITKIIKSINHHKQINQPHTQLITIHNNPMLKRILPSVISIRPLKYFYRLVKPNMSEFNSIEELQYDRKQRQLAVIDQINAQALKENRAFTQEKFITQILNTSQELSQGIMQRQLKFTAVSPQSLKSHTLQQNLGTAQIDFPFALQQVQSGLPDLTAVPMHFSYHRGAPIIPEYEMDKKIAYVFNLPDEFSTKEVAEKLGVETVKQIKVEYCRLGLPAYAKVYFNTDQAVNNLVLNNKTYIQVGSRLCFIKTHFDKEKLQLKNRRLVIHDIQQNDHNLLLELSQYGRVTHFDYPTFITRNPSLEQARQKYKHSEQLVKINHHRKNGAIESEYLPSLEETFRMNTLNTTAEFDSNLNERKQKIEAMYKNRMRYAQEVDVYEGKENEINVKSMGYCIVTFSCLEQAQNCYFGLRFSHKIQLFDSKSMQQFQVDQGYRKRVLRIIDSEYQKAKEKADNSQNLYEKEYEEYLDGLSMFDKLVELEIYAKSLMERVDETTEGEPEAVLSYFNNKVKEIKKGLGKKMATKSFDQLAEKELYGRVLPKASLAKPSLSLQITPQVIPQKQQLMKQKMPNLTTDNILARDKYYRKKKSRQVKRMGMEALDAGEFAEEAEGEGIEDEVPIEQEDAVEDYDGQKNSFSTQKKRNVAFRQRSAVELANYILRYCEYIRGIINEYQGIFPESRFSHTQNPTFLNPQSLYFADSTPFITQQDLPKFLQCLRTFQTAQQTYSEFWKTYQYVKSSSMNINQYKWNIRNGYYEGLKRVYDNGSVKEVYEVDEREDVAKKVLVLNATVAGFGEEFKQHVDENGKTVIIKVVKAEHICPMDRIALITKTRDQYLAKNPPTKQQLALFHKHKHAMLQSGEIPQQLRKSFNIPESKTLDDLFEELASEAGIYKKDIEMVVNMKNYTEEQLAADRGLQVQLERVRVSEKESRASDYAKDPQNIEVRDKEGYFKVSKFRQI